jgi:POT family proton-dependent oligopeptide transporter
MFKNQPKGLFALALANTGERFGYYTMLAVFVLFLKENFGLTEDQAGDIYATFLACVYFLPFIGGILADKFGYGKMVTMGIVTMFAGYVLLAWPLGTGDPGLYAMYGALALISIGTGLFKGNLQVMVGNLYDDPKYASKRDAAFSLFYMAINLGSLFAPSAASAMTKYALDAKWVETQGEAYHFAFAVACVSLIVSILIYLFTRRTFKHVENGAPKAKTTDTATQNENEKDTKSRIIALCLVFAVVIFFWMAFHQNGLTLTFFAEQFTNLNATAGFQSMSFNVWNLVLVIIAVYAGFSVVQAENIKSKILSTLTVLACVAGLVAIYIFNSDAKEITAEMFQQFNPFYVVALTPVSMAIFGWLANRGKEPSAPRKIALGMLVAGIGFGVLTYGSLGLNTPAEQKKSQIVADASNYAIQLDTLAKAKILSTELDSLQRDSKDSLIKEVSEEIEKYREKLMLSDSIRLAKADGDSIELHIPYFDAAYAKTNEAIASNMDLKDLNLNEVLNTKPLQKQSPYWLIVVYLILTFAELLLSPMGISFVSKVAPAKYKGMMMGGWFVATAIGNYLTKIGSMFWGDMPLWGVWTIFVACCLLSAIFMFAVMKKLEKVTK